MYDFENYSYHYETREDGDHFYRTFLPTGETVEIPQDCYSQERRDHEITYWPDVWELAAEIGLI